MMSAGMAAACRRGGVERRQRVFSSEGDRLNGWDPLLLCPAKAKQWRQTATRPQADNIGVSAETDRMKA